MAKRSFDMSPKKKGKEEAPHKRQAKRRAAKAESRHPVLSTRNQKRKLRDRRRDELMGKAGLAAAAFVIAAGAVLYVLWLPAMRIAEAAAEGFPDADAASAIALEALDGRYYGIIPRDNFFFYPEREVREALLAEFPSVSSVSVRRDGFTSLALDGRPRVAAFHWCGSPASLAAEDATCFSADAEGLVFLPVTPDASSTPMLHVYAELDTASSTGSYPISARVKGAEHLPDILRFARTLGSLGITIASVAIRGDEADIFVAPSTRITYVVGHEKEAEKSAKAALPKLSLEDGSIVYVDLRFDGKVYLKRAGE